MSSNKTLTGVTLHGQKTTMWCWAATGQMIMSYLGHNVSQCEQANQRFGRSDCCTNSSNCVRGGWPNFWHYGFSTTHTADGVALTLAQLKAEIDNNRPVAFTWRWPGGGGHMMVASGYYDDFQGKVGNDWVWVLNPWKDGDSGSSSAGAKYWISYSKYKSQAGHHTHWEDIYNIKKHVANATESASQSADEQQNAAAGTENPDSVFENPHEAAERALQMIHLMVDDESFGPIGLSKNIDSADGLNLAPPIPVQYIRADDLDNFQLGEDPRSILGPVEELLYPVYEGGVLSTSIEVYRYPNGSFEVTSIGRPNMIKAIKAVQETSDKDDDQFFLVQIPHVYHMFLGHMEDEMLLLTTVYAHPEFDIEPNQTFVANELLEILTPVILRNQGALIRD